MIFKRFIIDYLFGFFVIMFDILHILLRGGEIVYYRRLNNIQITTNIIKFDGHLFSASF
jgi:hypothetical protein